MSEFLDALEGPDKIRVSRELERYLGMTSTYYLGKNILGYDKAGKFHDEMCKWYDDNFLYNLLIIVPRQHYKTTYPNITGGIRNALVDPDVELCILVHNIKKAEDMLGEIKSHFMYNEKFRDLYPEHAVNTKKEEGTRSKFTTPSRRKKFLRQPTFLAGSIDEGLVSSHFTRFIYDDVVDKKNAATPELRDKTYQSYSLTLPMIKQMSATGVPWQHMFCTPWHFDDIPARLQNSPDFDRHWRLFHRQVEWNERDEEKGTKTYHILFPEEWDEERINFYRERLSSFDFACQYYCRPVITGEAVMQADKLRRFTEESIKNVKMNKCITVDPASSVDKSKGDPTVIGAYGMDSESNVYTLNVSRKWLEVNEIVEEIVHFHKLHNIRDIGIERVALSKWLIQLVEQRIREEHLNINVIEMTRDSHMSKKGSNSRQERVSGYLNQGQILIREEEPEEEIIMKELGEWPHGRYDDWMDTLTDAIEILKPYPVFVKKADQYRMPPRSLGGRANHQTGYSYRAGD